MILVVAASPSIDITYVVDALTPGEVHRPRSTHRLAGGKGLNVARVTKRLGADVTAVGIVGGHPGRWVTQSLAREGIEFVPVAGVADTRSCVSIADAASGALTEIYETATAVSHAEWEELEATVTALTRERRAGWVTVSGAFPADAPNDAVSRLVAAATAAGAQVVVDTHGRALGEALGSCAHLIKVNAAEAAAALEVLGATETSNASAAVDGPDPAALCHGLRACCADPAPAVVVTAGRQGAAAVFSDNSVHRVGPGALGNFPVGSGDAFLAGLVVALDRGADAAAALRSASAVAAANASVPGAGRLGQLPSSESP